MADAELLVEVTGPVATVVIHNPARRNAMTAAMWRQLPELLDGLEADPAVRALVLTGAGDTFCAGADLGDLDELLDAGDASIAVAAEERLATFRQADRRRRPGRLRGRRLLSSPSPATCGSPPPTPGSAYRRPGSAWSTRRRPPAGWPGWSARPPPSTCSSPPS